MIERLVHEEDGKEEEMGAGEGVQCVGEAALGAVGALSRDRL